MNMDIVEAIVEDLIEKAIVIVEDLIEKATENQSTITPSRATHGNELPGGNAFLVDIESLMEREEVVGIEFTIGGDEYKASSESGSENSQVTTEGRKIVEAQSAIKVGASSESGSATSLDAIDPRELLEANLEVGDREIKLESVNLDVVEAHVVHFGPRMFACSLCTQTSNRSHNIKLHINYCHTGKQDRSFICGNCPERFVTKRDLERHMEKKSPCYGTDTATVGRPVGSHTKTGIKRQPESMSEQQPKWSKVSLSGPHTRQATKRFQEAVGQAYMEGKLARRPYVKLIKLDVNNAISPNTSYEEPEALERMARWAQFRQYCLVHDLASTAIIGTFVGPHCRSGAVRNPFSYEDEVDLRIMLDQWRHGDIDGDSSDLLRVLYQRGNFEPQLEKVCGTKDVLFSLMADFLQLVTGEGQLEVFSLPPGAYAQDAGHLGLGVGIRHPWDHTPLEAPATVKQVYGDLYKIPGDILEVLCKWQLFSTVQIEGQDGNETYMMLGPLQLVNHSTEPNANYTFIDGKAVLNITKTLKPGEEVYVDYSRNYKNV